ncbi:MAG: DMT family transporter [Alphaproteobacteria bacterium]
MDVVGTARRLGRPEGAYARGVVLTLGTALAWSFTGLIFRHIEAATPWQILFFRAMLLSVALAVAFFAHHGRQTVRVVVAIGVPGLIAAVCLGLGSVFYIFAIQYTTIANVAFLTSAVPFFTAIFGWLILGEGVLRTTWACIALAMAGVAVMVVEGFAFGGGFGIMMALGSALVSAGYTIALRYGRTRDLSPCVMVSGVVTMAITAPFAGTLDISWHDLALCATQGVLISATCNVLFTYCARWVPAAQLTLLSLLESVLAPFWVWLFIHENPTVWTLVGGAIVLAAVAAQATVALRSGPAP